MENYLGIVTEESGVEHHQTSPSLDSRSDITTSTVPIPSGSSEISTTLSTLPTSFRTSKISIAVDASGSTFGGVLDAERKAIRSICTLVPRNLRSSIKILPWSDMAEEPKSFNQLDSLVSGGGTNPNVLIQHPKRRYALQESSFWFLMTDGLIESPIVQRFARGLLEYGLHGTACVISIFGDMEEKPKDCNITVGLSVFAVSPHAAFLYTNVESAKTFILQTKGCFSALLPHGKSNPVLDFSTSWEDLPEIAYEDLSRVSIPPPQAVGKTEVILNGGSKLDIAGLLQDLPEDDKLIAQILDNEDNLKTVTLTAKITNQRDRLVTWLDKIDHKLDSLDTVEPPPLQDHPQLLADVISKIGEPDTSNDLPSLQMSLQEANAEDASRLNNANEAKKSRSSRHRRSSGHVRRISDAGFDNAGDNIGGIPEPHSPVYRDHFPRAAFTTPLFLPGFHKPDSQREFFKGKCTLCAVETSVLALLLRAQPEKADTLHFPAPGTRSKLVYPLTMGNYPETDILSSFIACDPCSYRLVQRGKSPHGETLISALPMISFSKNKEPWLAAVQVATHKRFHETDIPMAFLSILYTKLERLLNEDATTPVQTLREALKWVSNMLLSEVFITPMNDSELDRFGIGALHEVLLRNFRNALDDVSKTALLEYPLDGFIVANVALSNSKHSSKISGSERKHIVFLRFLYHVTEQYHKYAAGNNSTVIHAAKALVLLLSDPIGPRSLLQWDRLRQLSLQANSLAELCRTFSQMSKKSQPFKLFVSIKELSDTPFLSVDTLNSFQRLGVLFSWISSQASHATAVFLHHLLRSDITDTSVQNHFEKIVQMPDVRLALTEPELLSARSVEDMIKGLPPMHLND